MKTKSELSRCFLTFFDMFGLVDAIECSFMMEGLRSCHAGYFIIGQWEQTGRLERDFF